MRSIIEAVKMTTDDAEILFANMSIPVVLGPILETLEQKDKGVAQTLRAAFIKVEQTNPGFAYSFIRGLLQKAELHGQVDMCESLLRLGLHESDDLRISRPEQAFQELNYRASGLKRILSRIPDQITNRREFLETIKEIASAIKLLLDAVNNVINFIPVHENKQKLERSKRDFVRYSKKFSDTLKDFFKKSQSRDVFISANYLVNQTNQILKEVKSVS